MLETILAIPAPEASQLIIATGIGPEAYIATNKSVGIHKADIVVCVDEFPAVALRLILESANIRLGGVLGSLALMETKKMPFVRVVDVLYGEIACFVWTFSVGWWELGIGFVIGSWKPG